MKLTKQHVLIQLGAEVSRLEYRCNVCTNGYYRYNPNASKKLIHNQHPHSCTSCGREVYFTFPYPALYYKHRIFVDWETIKGFNILK